MCYSTSPVLQRGRFRNRSRGYRRRRGWEYFELFLLRRLTSIASLSVDPLSSCHPRSSGGVGYPPKVVLARSDVSIVGLGLAFRVPTEWKGAAAPIAKLMKQVHPKVLITLSCASPAASSSWRPVSGAKPHGCIRFRPPLLLRASVDTLVVQRMPLCVGAELDGSNSLREIRTRQMERTER